MKEDKQGCDSLDILHPLVRKYLLADRVAHFQIVVTLLELLLLKEELA